MNQETDDETLLLLKLWSIHKFEYRTISVPFQGAKISMKHNRFWNVILVHCSNFGLKVSLSLVPDWPGQVQHYQSFPNCKLDLNLFSFQSSFKIRGSPKLNICVFHKRYFRNALFYWKYLVQIFFLYSKICIWIIVYQSKKRFVNPILSF